MTLAAPAWPAVLTLGESGRERRARRRDGRGGGGARVSRGQDHERGDQPGKVGGLPLGTGLCRGTGVRGRRV